MVEVVDIYEKAVVVIRAWLSMRPEKKFFGMGTEDFNRIIEPSGAVRKEIKELEDRINDAVKRRDEADRNTRRAVLRVINAIRGTEGEGEDSPLLAAMGYMPHTARTSMAAAARKLNNAARVAAREATEGEVKS